MSASAPGFHHHSQSARVVLCRVVTLVGGSPISMPLLSILFDKIKSGFITQKSSLHDVTSIRRKREIEFFGPNYLACEGLTHHRILIELGSTVFNYQRVVVQFILSKKVVQFMVVLSCGGGWLITMIDWSMKGGII